MRAAKPCPPGSERNPETGRCRKVRAKRAAKGKRPCPPGTERNPETGRCRKVRVTSVSDIPRMGVTTTTSTGRKRQSTVQREVSKIAEKQTRAVVDKAFNAAQAAYKRDPAGFLEKAKVAGAWSIPMALLTAVVVWANKREAEMARRFIEDQVNRTQASIRRPLTGAEANALTVQYAEFFAKKLNDARDWLQLTSAGRARRDEARKWLTENIRGLTFGGPPLHLMHFS